MGPSQKVHSDQHRLPCRSQQPFGRLIERVAHLADGEEDVEEGRERESAVAVAATALETGAVVAHVDVGQLLDELHQEGHHRVQPVRAHLLAHERRQRARGRADPSVQHVGRT